MDQKLTVRRAPTSDLLDKDVIFTVGKEMKSNFYFVSAGIQGEHLVFDAFDKNREVRLELRLKWQDSVHANSVQPSY